MHVQNIIFFFCSIKKFKRTKMWRQVWCYTIRLQGVSIVFYSTPIYLFLRVHNLEEEFYTKNCYFLSTLSFRFVPSIDQSATILPREKKRHDIKPDSTSNQQILLPATCFFYPKSLTFLLPSKEELRKKFFIKERKGKSNNHFSANKYPTTTTRKRRE